MREPGFWWSKPGLVARLLSPFSWIYGAVAQSRMKRGGTRAGIPVICVGNFTLGGTGKTPTAIAIARLLVARGEKPFFLSRGYGGSLAGPVQVDPARHDASEVGDEPLLLARVAPVIVSRDRGQGAARARSSGATVIVMDDGLQNPSIVKDLSIAVVDARRGFGNAQVFPAGPLRAPLTMQLKEVRALLLIGSGSGAGPVLELARSHRRPVLVGALEPDADAVKAIGRKKVLAFAGIGDPQKFFATLANAGIEAQIERSFPDHHAFSESEAADILARCRQDELVPVTTEKDLARIGRGRGALATLAATAKALPVTLVVEDEDALSDLLREALSEGRAKVRAGDRAEGRATDRAGD